jgi:signal transduction histidine kinase
MIGAGRTRRAPRREVWLLRGAAYLILLFIAVLVVSLMPGPRRLPATLLLVAVALPMWYFAEPTRRPAWVRAYLATQTLLVLGVYLLHPPAALGVSQLFYLLTTQAALCLTLPEAGAWAALYAVITVLGGVNVMGMGEISGSLAAAGGNLVFLGLGAALRHAGLANARSRRLLDDLRQAHDRLHALSEQAQQLAVADERNRIAREMHDALGHRLTVAVVQLEGARRLVARDPDRAGAIIDTMRGELKLGLAELRETVANMRSPAEAPLPVTLGRLAMAFEAATALPVTVAVDHEAAEHLTAEQRHTLYRVAQEALTNIQRHAHATRARLTLVGADGAVTLTVEDDGRGFPAAAAGPSPNRDAERFGLRGIEERVRAHGGTLALGACEGGGATLTATLPAPPPGASSRERALGARDAATHA